jgi:2-C-methyl-D-erythritol 4-phosphate cytidylyltransferase
MKTLSNPPKAIWAIVPAAGVGSRFSGSTQKQYTKINGKTILEHSVHSLLQTNLIQKVYIAIASDDTAAAQLPSLTDKRIEFIIGGKSRAHSVLNALIHLQRFCSPDDWVIIHDAARPCLTLFDLDRLLQALVDTESAVILATPATDTLKHVSNNRVETTVDRRLIWQALTPQAFRISLIFSALQTALQQGLNITDESSALEMSGLKPLVLNGLRSNIKVTYPEDLALANFYLTEEKTQLISTESTGLHLCH